MLLKELTHFFERDLLKLTEEISLYESEDDLWKVSGEISNSGGNLCLHIIGNLNHFIGATLGNTGYTRDRDSEFTRKNVARLDIIRDIAETIRIVKTTLSGLNDDDLNKDFALEKHNQIVSNKHMLLHLLTHLNYHLGQVNYHRRLISL